jgi:hypothetical protein
MVELVWHNDPAGDKTEVEAAIWHDISGSLYEGILDKPSSLVFHTVFLGPSMDEGPVIHMWGEEGDDDNLHCKWINEVKWVSYSELEMAEDQAALSDDLTEDEDFS